MGELREVEFRDGKRPIPDHLADMMSGLPTHTLTFEQAKEKANWRLASDHANSAMDALRQSHFGRGIR